MDLTHANPTVNTGKSLCLVTGLPVHTEDRGEKPGTTYAVTERLSAASSAFPLHSLKT